MACPVVDSCQSPRQTQALWPGCEIETVGRPTPLVSALQHRLVGDSGLRSSLAAGEAGGMCDMKSAQKMATMASGKGSHLLSAVQQQEQAVALEAIPADGGRGMVPTGRGGWASVWDVR